MPCFRLVFTPFTGYAFLVIFYSRRAKKKLTKKKSTPRITDPQVATVSFALSVCFCHRIIALKKPDSSLNLPKLLLYLIQPLPTFYLKTKIISVY